MTSNQREINMDSNLLTLVFVLQITSKATFFENHPYIDALHDEMKFTWLSPFSLLCTL